MVWVRVEVGEMVGVGLGVQVRVQVRVGVQVGVGVKVLVEQDTGTAAVVVGWGVPAQLTPAALRMVQDKEVLKFAILANKVTQDPLPAKPDGKVKAAPPETELAA